MACTPTTKATCNPFAAAEAYSSPTISEGCNRSRFGFMLSVLFH